MILFLSVFLVCIPLSFPTFAFYRLPCFYSSIYIRFYHSRNVHSSLFFILFAFNHSFYSFLPSSSLTSLWRRLPSAIFLFPLLLHFSITLILLCVLLHIVRVLSFSLSLFIVSITLSSFVSPGPAASMACKAA